MRPLIVLVTLTAFLAACTREVPRESVPVRHYRVDWAASNAPVLRLGDLAVQGLVFTPAQWPLESSLKHLLAANFAGVIEGLDLRFHSSTVPSGALEELYDQGYLPAYVHVENTGHTPFAFDPRALAVRADSDTLLPAVAPAELPRGVRRIDWVQTGAVVAAVALLAVLAVAARQGSSADHVLVRGQFYVNPGYFSGPYASRGGTGFTEGGGPARIPPRRDAGLLRAATLAPGEAREGFVLFALDHTVQDWRTARLTLGP